MTASETKCPCCGQSTAPISDVSVSLTENRLFYQEQSLQLTSRLAELAFILARRMPETVSHGAIVQQMWGDCEGDFADTNIKVAICQLRPLLKPLDLQIITTWGKGYRLAPLVRTERSTQRETTSAQA